MRPNILLTGATGFLGSHLLNDFVSHGLNVVVLKRNSSNTRRINHLLSEVKTYDIDKTDLKHILKVEKPEIIIHTACNYGRDNNRITDIVNTNLMFGLHLLENAIDNDVQTFINTDTLLPKNLNNYSLSKRQLTEWLQILSKQIQVINIRVEHMYGIDDDKKKFIPWLIDRMINNNAQINLTSGVQKRDFIYIDDVVQAYIQVLNKRQELKSWNEFDLGTNTYTPVKEMVLAIAKEIEEKYKTSVLSRLRFGAIPYREGEIMKPILNNLKLRQLGWIPKVKVEDGIKKIIKFL